MVKVKEVELYRRPNRATFTILLGIEEGTQFWNFFNTTNIANSSVTKVCSVQTKKLFQEELKIIVGRDEATLNEVDQLIQLSCNDFIDQLVPF